MTRRRTGLAGLAVALVAVAVVALVVSADREGSTEDVPVHPVAVLDYRWASPWAGITDLHGGGPDGIGFTMWESFDVACEVERSDDGSLRVVEQLPGGQGAASTRGPTLTLGVDEAVWSLGRGPVLTVEYGGEVTEVPVPVEGQSSRTWGPGGLVADDDGVVWFAVGQYRTHTIEWVVGHVADAAPNPAPAADHLGGLCA